jgi:accessory gene regulator protein AgrB
MIIKCIVWLTIGLFIQEWAEWALIFLAFLLARIIIGGEHARSFIVCMIWTEFWFLSAWGMSILFQWFDQKDPQVTALIFSIAMLVVAGALWRHSLPVPSGKRVLTKRRKYFSRFLFLSLLIFCLITLFFSSLVLKVFSVGVLVVMLASLPVFHKILIRFETYVLRRDES